MEIPLPAHHTLHHDKLPYSRPPTPGQHPLQIGFLGLGAMGYFMARNLATHKASHPVSSPPLLVYNRTAAKAEKLVKELGENTVRAVQSAGDLANECDVIITNLANDDAVKSVYKEFDEALSVRVFLRFEVGLLLTLVLRNRHRRRTKSLSKRAR